jgi:diacylglycerol kinase (ATP)
VITVIVNPNKVGDTRQAHREVETVAAEFGLAAPRWVETSRADPGPGHARRALDDGAELVLVWGGDGTMIGVAAALAHSGVPLGIIPGGTANLLARNLGVPLGILDAMATAFGGRDRAIDLLDVDLGHDERRVSAVMCGAGWDAAMMAAPEAMKRRFGWGAYAYEGARQIRQKPMRLRISVDGGPPQELTGRTVLVANVGTLVAGRRLLPEAEPDDGFLEVLVIDPTTPLDWVRTTASIATSRGTHVDPSRTLLRGREVVVRTGHSRKRQIDGDLVSDGSDFHVRVLPRALVVRVPG